MGNIKIFLFPNGNFVTSHGNTKLSARRLNVGWWLVPGARFTNV
jgi:hypothetical protein